LVRHTAGLQRDTVDVYPPMIGGKNATWGKLKIRVKTGHNGIWGLFSF
jgi:hypothetical protein